MTNIDMDAKELAKYLNIALKQRERALNKFIQDYGPSSATVGEVTAETAELRKVIIDLERAPTPIENAIDKNKK